MVNHHAPVHRPTRTLPVDSTDSDDDIQPPPELSRLGQSVLQQSFDAGASPNGDARPVRFKLVKSDRKSGSASNTPVKNTTTPAPSVRIRRVGLSGAPVRRGKRTPQSEEEHGSSQNDHPHDQEPGTDPRQEQLPSQDQENIPVSVPRSKTNIIIHSDVLVKPDPGSVVKSQPPVQIIPVRERTDKAPLAQVSANTPLRPAPPPPPKMSVLEAATKAAGASATRKKSSRRPPFIVNGKSYQPLERCGKGGSAEVWRVQAENGKVFALKRVRLHGQDPAAIQGYKGEIDLLNKMKGNPRVVELFDYAIDDEKEVLYVVSEFGTELLFTYANIFPVNGAWRRRSQQSSFRPLWP
jgi:serine/threonine-protein kinase TTK/MPS1